MQFVYGLSKSGISVLKFLKKKKKIIYCWDDNKTVREKIKKKFPNLKLSNPNNLNLNTFEKIYLSPGISLKEKKFKNVNKLKINRDLNAYLKNATKEKIVAITGTNGKSTTTKLIGDMFKKSYFSTFVGGNIGNPLLNAFLGKQQYTHHVVELSSFQLETINNFNPHVSIILNLSKDHLNRYKNYNEYINQKKKIFSRKNTSYNLISMDDKESCKLLKSKNIINKISFSLNNNHANVFIKKDFIYDNYFYKKNKKIRLNEFSNDLSCSFNIQNILVTYIVSRIFKIKKNIFYKTLKEFKGLPFRNKVVRNNSKYLIINNSKATNLQSTLDSIKEYENIYLIIGGRAKEKEFNKIKKFSKNIIQIYTFGESANMIKNQIGKKIETKKYKNLKILVKNIFQNKKEQKIKKTILFAPACTSYDQYKNFEERGKHFNELINLYTRN